MKLKHVRGSAPNDNTELTVEGYDLRRGKVSRPPIRFANVGGHGLGGKPDDLKDVLDKGAALLDEALK